MEQRKTASLFDRMDTDQQDILDLDKNNQRTLVDTGSEDQELFLDDIDKSGNLDKQEHDPTKGQVVEGHENVDDDPDISGNEEVDKDNVDIQIEGNILSIFAEKWKEEGKLPSDFEVTDSLTEEQLDEAMYNHALTNSLTRIRTEVLEEIVEKEGLTPQMIEAAKLLYNKVPQEDILNEDFYRKVASIQIDPSSDSYENEVRELGILYHMDRGFSKEKAEVYVDTDLADGSTNAVAEYQAYFKNRAVDLKNKIIKTEQDAIREREERQKKEKDQQIAWLQKGEIGGVKYTKDQTELIRKAMFDRTELVVDPNGNRRLITLEHKKILEAKHDPEKHFQSRVNFILGYNPQKIESDAIVKANNNLVKKLHNTIKVVPKADLKSSPRQQSQQVFKTDEREIVS